MEEGDQEQREEEEEEEESQLEQVEPRKRKVELATLMAIPGHATVT